MKWKLVPVEPTPEMVWKAEEESPPFHHGDPWYGSEPPSEDQVRTIYTAMLEAAPQPQKLSDERILRHLDAILKASGSGLKNYSMHKIIEDMKQAVRAIEREILGENNDSN